MLPNGDTARRNEVNKAAIFFQTVFFIDTSLLPRFGGGLPMLACGFVDGSELNICSFPLWPA